jgi:HEAT repeat protein
VLLLVLAQPPARAGDDLEEMAKDVREYPTKFRLIALGRRALAPLVRQSADGDRGLAFESRSAARWIVRHAAGDLATCRAIAEDLAALAGADAPASQRAFVAEILGELGHAGVEPLAHLLGDADTAVRRAAVASLELIPDPAAGAALAEGLDDRSLSELVWPALARRPEAACQQRLLTAARAGDAGAVRALGLAGPSREADVELLLLARSGSAPAAEALLLRGERLGNPSLLLSALELAEGDLARLAALRALDRVPARGEEPPAALLLACRDAVAGIVAQRALVSWAEANPGAAAAARLSELLASATDRGVVVRALAAWAAMPASAGIAPLLPHLRSDETSIRTTAIVALSDRPGEAATAALAEACQAQQDVDVLRLAIASLGSRGDPAGAAVLEAYLTEGPEAVRRAAGEAYVRLAESSPDADAQAMYLKALDAGARGVALAGLARVGDASVIPAIARRLGDAAPEERQAAAATLVAIGDRLEAQGLRDDALAAWRRALEGGAAVENRLRLLGERVEVTSREGRVSAWWILGPFPAAGQDAWTATLGPETGVDLDAKREDERRWIPVQVGGEDAVVDLDGMFQPNDRVVAYAYAEIVTRKERDVVLKMGSDDGIRCWVNGELVHEALVPRGLTVDQDTVKAHLVEGTNRLLLKVCELGGGWEFALRIEDDQGRPLKFRIR